MENTAITTGNLPQVFNFAGAEVRITLIANEPWFLAKEICDILDIKNVSDALSSLDEDEKSTIALSDSTSGGNPNKLIVNESGLYSLVLRSRKPEAKSFKKWITSVVLPTIRKTGAYMTETFEDQLKKTMAGCSPEALLLIQTVSASARDAELKFRASESEKKKLEYFNKQNVAALKAQAPLANFGALLQASPTNINSTQLAKMLGLQSSNRLHEWLHHRGIIFKQAGIWTLYAPYVSKDFAVPKAEPIYSKSNPNYVIGTKYFFDWTPAGQLQVFDIWNKADETEKSYAKMGLFNPDRAAKYAAKQAAKAAKAAKKATKGNQTTLDGIA